MTTHCPKCSSSTKNIMKYGFYVRKSDSRIIQRFKCKSCLHHFSSATFSRNYNQNRRRLNPLIAKQHSSLTSQRRLAIILGCNRKTIARKLKILAEQARQDHKAWIKDKVFDHVQFDDLETIEHTKMKPVTVTVIVSRSRKILGFEVARIPAKGLLASKSRKKYGLRPNEAPQARDRLFNEISSHIHPQAII